MNISKATTNFLKAKSELVNQRSAVFNWLKEELLIRGNQKYLSDKLSITKQFVNQVANGKKNLSDDDLLLWIKLIEDKT